MSTPTETDFRDEDVPQDDTTTPVVPGTDQDQHEHHHHHDHTHEDGELSPLCVGGGCVTKAPGH